MHLSHLIICSLFLKAFGFWKFESRVSRWENDLEPLTNYNYICKSIKVIISFNNMFYVLLFLKELVLYIGTRPNISGIK